MFDIYGWKYSESVIFTRWGKILYGLCVRRSNTQSVKYTLPDGQTIKFDSRERYSTPELLFSFFHKDVTNFFSAKCNRLRLEDCTQFELHFENRFCSPQKEFSSGFVPILLAFSDVDSDFSCVQNLRVILSCVHSSQSVFSQTGLTLFWPRFLTINSFSEHVFYPRFLTLGFWPWTAFLDQFLWILPSSLFLLSSILPQFFIEKNS